jgi:hypothetical protein
MTYIILNCPNGKSKKILLFGETHDNINQYNEKQQQIQTIIEYVTDIIYLSNYEKKCIDVIMEQGFDKGQGYGLSLVNKSHKKQNTSSSLTEMRDLLLDCKTSGTQKPNECIIGNRQIDNLRVHNFDLRDFSINNPSNLEFYKLMHPPSSRSNQMLYGRSFANTYKLLLDDNNGLKLFVKYMLGYIDIEDIDMETYITKNIDEGLNDYINKNKIITEFKTLRHKIVKTYTKFIRTQQNFIPDNKVLRDIILEYYISNFIDAENITHAKKIMIFVSIFTDFYILMRLLTQFDDKKRGPEKCKNHNELDKIIIYGGGGHNDIVIDILKLLYNGDCIKYQNINNNKNLAKYEKEIIFSKFVKNEGYNNFTNIIADFVM